MKCDHSLDIGGAMRFVLQAADFLIDKESVRTLCKHLTQYILGQECQEIERLKVCILGLGVPWFVLEQLAML